MGLLESALDALGDQINDRADDWFDDLVNKLDGLVESTLDETLKHGGQEILQILKDNPSKFVKLGKRGFIVFTAHVASGKTDEAHLEWLKHHATARDIIEDILKDAVELAADKQAREDLKDQAWEVVKLMAKGAKFLLPLLLAIV